MTGLTLIECKKWGAAKMMQTAVFTSVFIGAV